MARDLGVGLGDGVLARRDALELLGPGEPVVGGGEPVAGAQRQLDLGVGGGAVGLEPLAVGCLDLELDGALGDLLLGDGAAEGLGDLQVAGVLGVVVRKGDGLRLICRVELCIAGDRRTSIGVCVASNAGL